MSFILNVSSLLLFQMGTKKDFIAVNGKAKAPKVKKSKENEAQQEFVPYSHSRGIVYLSHLPHGLYEKELRSFLQQFGAVTNLRLGRSKKSGQSKGYAFVEFRYPEVAQIVAETMNNYLMFDKLVKCESLPPEKVSKRCFREKVDPKMPPQLKKRQEGKRQVNQLRTEEQNNRRLKKQLRRLEGVKKKLEAAGVKSQVELGQMALPSGKTPVMEVDEDDDDIKMKTPPNVRKIKSRGNSAVNSHANTPKLKGNKKATGLQQQLMAEQIAKKLKGSSSSSSPAVSGSAKKKNLVAKQSQSLASSPAAKSKKDRRKSMKT